MERFDLSTRGAAGGLHRCASWNAEYHTTWSALQVNGFFAPARSSGVAGFAPRHAGTAAHGFRLRSGRGFG